jgi:hypothetical protein
MKIILLNLEEIEFPAALLRAWYAGQGQAGG